MRISKKQLMIDLKDSVFDPRAPGRFSATIEGMGGEFIASTAVVKIREGLEAFKSAPHNNAATLDAALRDGIALLAYSRSLLLATRDVEAGPKAGPPFGA